MHSKQAKRILAVTVKQMIDDSPDTSYLGEYSDRPTSQFSIDRKHSLECASQTYNVTVKAIRTVKHAITYLNDTYLPGQWPSDSQYVDDAIDASDVLGEALDAMGECDCGESGDMQRHEYRYFNPSFNYVDKQGQPKDLTPEEVRKYTQQDYERLESLNKGDWAYMGVRAEAEVQLGSDVVQHISSGGLWGIESDRESSDLKEIEEEQLSELRSELEAIGFSKRAVSAAFRDIRHKAA